MSINFCYHTFVAVSQIFARKVPVFDGFLSAHEQEIYHTTPLDENCIAVEFQTDPNYYVDLRSTFLVLKLKVVKRRGYENYKTRETKRSTKKRR